MTKKLDGVQLIHSHNHTQFTRAACASIYEFNNIKELPYNSDLEYNEYHNLRPDIYKCKINDKYYAFILHEDLTKDDKLIIKNPYNIFSINNVSKNNIIVYNFYDGLLLNRYGYELKNTANDNLDALIIDGKTEYEEPLGFNSPGKIKHLNDLNIRIHDKSIYINDIEFVLKNNIKSIGSNVYDKKNYIYDTLYLDSYRQKALYKFNLGSLIIDEYSIFTIIEERDDFVTLFLENKNSKLKSHLVSNYFKTVDSLEFFYNHEDNISCITSALNQNGIYFKIYRDDYGETLADFKQKLANITHDKTMDNIEIIYEYPISIYKHILLDNYEIPLRFGGCDIIITPFNKKIELNNIYNDNIEFDNTNAYIDNNTYWNNIYVSGNLNIRSIFFYKRLNI